MDARLIKILTKKCAISAAKSAKTICDLAKQREMDFNTLVKQFQNLLPSPHQLDPINDWDGAERVITRAYFILESQEVARNYYKR